MLHALTSKTFALLLCVAEYVCEMPCYRPLTAYRSREKTKTGRHRIIFKKEDALPMSELQLPCGQCIGCRLERSRQWAIRCVHEASQHEENSFITLTYNEENLPPDGGLVKKHFQLFMKRFRKKYEGKKIRYFHCGEYGEKNLRPHYHACIFGHDFTDREIFKTNNNINIYTSNALSNLWPYGFATVGNVTFDSAAYVARYVMKKVTGKDAETLKPGQITLPYERLDPETGELIKVIPEYTTMSRRPGIGSSWYKKYESDVYPDDFIIINGAKMQPPKFYDSMYEHLPEIKEKRITRAIQKRADNTPERLATRERCKLAQIVQLQRLLED